MGSSWDPDLARAVIAAMDDPSRIPATLEMIPDEQPRVRDIQIHVMLEQPERALELLAKMDDMSSFIAWAFAWDVRAEALRRHPEFTRVIEDGEFIEYWNATSWPELCRPAGDGVECQ